MGLMFMSLNVEPQRSGHRSPRWTPFARNSRLGALRSREASWGYRLLVIDDPDGNQLFFNYPADTTIAPCRA